MQVILNYASYFWLGILSSFPASRSSMIFHGPLQKETCGNVLLHDSALKENHSNDSREKLLFLYISTPS